MKMLVCGFSIVNSNMEFDHDLFESSWIVLDAFAVDSFMNMLVEMHYNAAAEFHIIYN